MKKETELSRTEVIKTRKKRFLTIAVTLIVALVPTASVFAGAASPEIPEEVITIPFDATIVRNTAGGAVAAPAKKSAGEDTVVVINPDAIGASYYDKTGNIVQNAKLGRQKQGPGASAMFSASTPKGWTEAFPFSMTIDGVNDSSLKDGILKIYIPGTVQKAGRVYAVLGLDKNGKIHLYQDTDARENVFSANLDLEGYAFDLIFFDAK
ncbi:MAG: hypothetical protein K6D90_04455 [Lachnospiraceae bacterium]|nr:hypothetical protein [Lachnospiraceae bacterium]